jgi:hypothetical protein
VYPRLLDVTYRESPFVDVAPNFFCPKNRIGDCCQGLAGTRFPWSNCGSFRAAKIEAGNRSTRFRLSSTNQEYHYSPCIRPLKRGIFMHKTWCIRSPTSHCTTKRNDELCCCDRSGYASIPQRHRDSRLRLDEAHLRISRPAYTRCYREAKLRNEGP